MSQPEPVASGRSASGSEGDRWKRVGFPGRLRVTPPPDRRHMTWGAVNEWTTQAAYAVSKPLDHPTLATLLLRIMKQEGRAHRLLRHPGRGPRGEQTGHSASPAGRCAGSGLGRQRRRPDTEWTSSAPTVRDPEGTPWADGSTGGLTACRTRGPEPPGAVPSRPERAGGSGQRSGRQPHHDAWSRCRLSVHRQPEPTGGASKAEDPAVAGRPSSRPSEIGGDAHPPEPTVIPTAEPARRPRRVEVPRLATIQ